MARVKDFPYIPEDMMRALEAAFPDKAPRNPDLSAGAVGMMAGQQSVLDFLRHRLSLQQQPERNL